MLFGRPPNTALICRVALRLARLHVDTTLARRRIPHDRGDAETSHRGPDGVRVISTFLRRRCSCSSNGTKYAISDSVNGHFEAYKGLAHRRASSGRLSACRQRAEQSATNCLRAGTVVPDLAVWTETDRALLRHVGERLNGRAEGFHAGLFAFDRGGWIVPLVPAESSSTECVGAD